MPVFSANYFSFFVTAGDRMYGVGMNKQYK